MYKLYGKAYGWYSILALCFFWASEQSTNILTSWWLSQWATAQIIYQVDRGQGRCNARHSHYWLPGFSIEAVFVAGCKHAILHWACLQLQLGFYPKVSVTRHTGYKAASTLLTDVSQTRLSAPSCINCLMAATLDIPLCLQTSLPATSSHMPIHTSRACASSRYRFCCGL